MNEKNDIGDFLGSVAESLADNDLTIKQLDAPEGAIGLQLCGELDLASAPALRQAFEPAVDQGARAIVLDLGEVTFIDSSILRELLWAADRMRKRDGAFILAAVQSPVLRLFELTRTEELFELVDSLDAAWALIEDAGAGVDGDNFRN